MHFGTILSRSLLDWSSIKWVISLLKALKHWPPQAGNLAHLRDGLCWGGLTEILTVLSSNTMGMIGSSF